MKTTNSAFFPFLTIIFHSLSRTPTFWLNPNNALLFFPLYSVLFSTLGCHRNCNKCKEDYQMMMGLVLFSATNSIFSIILKTEILDVATTRCGITWPAHLDSEKAKWSRFIIFFLCLQFTFLCDFLAVSSWFVIHKSRIHNRWVKHKEWVNNTNHDKE